MNARNTPSPQSSSNPQDLSSPLVLGAGAALALVIFSGPSPLGLGFAALLAGASVGAALLWRIRSAWLAPRPCAAPARVAWAPPRGSRWAETPPARAAPADEDSYKHAA